VSDGDQELRRLMIIALKKWRNALEEADILKQEYMDAKDRYVRTLSDAEE
jgi:hypothetical protein